MPAPQHDSGQVHFYLLTADDGQCRPSYLDILIALTYLNLHQFDICRNTFVKTKW